MKQKVILFMNSSGLGSDAKVIYLLKKKVAASRFTQTAIFLKSINGEKYQY